MNTAKGRRQRRILTPTETEKFESQLEQDKIDHTETDQFFPGENRAGIVDEQLIRMKSQLKHNTPGSLTKYERAEKEKRILELKEYFIKNLVPKSGVVLRPQSGGVQNPDFRRAANLMASVEMSPQFQGFAMEWKNICRELGRPDEANLEYLRPS